MSPLIATGDPLPHAHDLPGVPTVPSGKLTGRNIPLENAVAECASCHRLFVSREVDDSWSGSVCWVPLRWWHRTAQAKLRLERARREGGVAP